MSVKETLDKISERHPDVIGAMVSSNGEVYHNLMSPYDMISVETVVETFEEILEQSAMLADEGYDFGECMMDFETHSFIARKLKNGLLVVLAPRLQRGQLVKLHVGLGLFGKAVQKELEAQASASAAPAPASERPLSQPAAAPVSTPVSVADAGTPFDGMGGTGEGESHGRRPRGSGSSRRRNIGDKIASRRAEEEAAEAAEAMDATSRPVSKHIDATTGEEIPLRPDGTPMRKRVYRGSVYWE